MFLHYDIRIDPPFLMALVKTNDTTKKKNKNEAKKLPHVFKKRFGDFALSPSNTMFWKECIDEITPNVSAKRNKAKQGEQ